MSYVHHIREDDNCWVWNLTRKEKEIRSCGLSSLKASLLTLATSELRLQHKTWKSEIKVHLKVHRLLSETWLWNGVRSEFTHEGLWIENLFALNPPKTYDFQAILLALNSMLHRMPFPIGYETSYQNMFTSNLCSAYFYSERMWFCGRAMTIYLYPNRERNWRRQATGRCLSVLENIGVSKLKEMLSLSKDS